MARIVMIGGGVVGLCGAMLLARDGHDVTVLERDPAPPPEPTSAWDEWTRRGVNQFRQLHYFLPRFRAVLEAELPDVVAALDGANALRFNPLTIVPPEVTGERRADDDRFEVLTGRRPMVEAVVAGVAASTHGCAVRRGAPVRALRAGSNGTVPHVSGVVLESGEEIDADIVIDASGRRSALCDQLEAIGATRPAEERHDCGFVYYARHFRSTDGSVPPMIGPPLQHYGSVSVITLPADNGYWGVGVVASARDVAARSMRDPAVWEHVIRSFPLIAHWVDAECVSDGVEIMAKIEDRYRRFSVAGRPCATGVLALGDSFACTNPSLGRGASFGLMHAVALRDLLRDHDGADPYERAVAWDDVSEFGVGPYVREALHFDGHRLAEIDAVIAGLPYETHDRAHNDFRALAAVAGRDPELLRGYIEIMSVLARSSDVLSRPAITERLAAVRRGAQPEPLPGPRRDELVTLFAT